MFLRSVFALTLIVTLLIQTLNAMNPEYFQESYHEDLAETNSNDNDDEQYLTAKIKRDTLEEEYDDDDDLVKRNRYPHFYLSPLWLSRRTRSNRFFGKPLWISRPGR